MLPTTEDCQKVVHRYTKGAGIFTDYVVVPLGDTPLGFLGDHYNLKINYKINSEYKTKSFFLKTVPNGTANHTEYVNSLGVFEKEALLYKNLFIDFQKFHAEKIVPTSYLVNPERFIILEDLSIQGFQVHDGDLGIEQWRCLIETMARFHASTIVFEEQRSILGNVYKLSEHNKKELNEATFVKQEGHPRYKWAKNTTQAVIDSIQFIPNYMNDRKIEEKLRAIMKEDIYEYTRPSKQFRNVITHADLWKNNVMFRKTNQLEAVLIDFQLVRYAPPALDLLTTIYMNSNEEFVRENKYNLLNLYHHTFTECLIKNQIEPDHILSYKDFMDSIAHYTLPALIEATLFATIIFVSPELSNEMMNNEQVFEEFTFTDRSKHVLNEIKQNVNFRDKYLPILKQLINCLDNFEM